MADIERELGYSLYTLDDLHDVEGARVLTRCDYNVGFNEDGNIDDTTRIDASTKTIQDLRDAGAKVILMSHLGRPKENEPEFSLRPVADYLSNILGITVGFVKDFSEDELEKIGKMSPRDVVLLENLRYDKREKKNDKVFIEGLAKLGMIYVNDSFGTAHNGTDASTIGLPEYFKKHHRQVAAGRLMVDEIHMLAGLLNPQGYPVAVIGGAKVSDKVGVINELVKRYKLCIVGAMANTFLKAQYIGVGNSFYEEDSVETARILMGHYTIATPIDVVVATAKNVDQVRNGNYSDVRTVNLDRGEKVNQEEMILDIGPRTAELYARELGKAGTIAWNGPAGVFEIDDFAKGSDGILRAIAESAEAVLKVAGGGETLRAIHGNPYANELKISTGGGAMLQFIEKRGMLPGIIALRK
ncbi:MAG: phosphoglycerate kinase [Candidatus Woesearchaeota archaeon]